MDRDRNSRTRGIIVSEGEYTVGRRILLDETDRNSEVLLTFPKTMKTFRETGCYAVGRLGKGDDAEIVKDTSEHNDFYGYLTSLAEPLVSAIEWNKKFASTLNVELRLCIRDFIGITVEPTEYEANWSGHWFVNPPSDWINVTSPEQLATAEARMAEKDWVKALDIRPDYFSGTSREIVLWSNSDGVTVEEATSSIEARLRDLVIAGANPPGEGDDWFEKRIMEIRKCFAEA